MDNNSYTIGIVSGVGLAFFLGFGSQKLWQKLLAFACAALMAHAVFFSFSRGGMLSLCIVGIVCFMVAYTVLMILLRPIYSAVVTIFVCVAECPAALDANLGHVDRGSNGDRSLAE